MKDPMCAVDSLPLKSEIFETYDYSGLQVYGPSHVSLAAASRESRLSGDGMRLELTLEPGLTWDDGEPVVARDFARGALKAIEANAFLRKFVFRRLTKLDAEDGTLVATFSRPNYRAADFFSLPNFVPFRAPGRCSGAYVMTSTAPGAYRYRRHAFAAAPLESFFVKEVRSPEENLLQFERGVLDVTSDTAFPFDRWQELKDHPNFASRDAGLRAVLLFKGVLASPSARAVRADIARIARETDLAPVLGGACARIAAPAPGLAPAPAGHASFRLAYDAFYPNREVCERLARDLEARGGHSVELVEDDYYAPYQDYDMKLCIIRDLAPGRYLRYAAMPFNSAIKADPALQQGVLASLDRLESESSETAARYAELDGLLSGHAAEIPLFSLPSCYLSRLPGRTNPLLPAAAVPEYAR